MIINPRKLKLFTQSILLPFIFISSYNLFSVADEIICILI